MKTIDLTDITRLDADSHSSKGNQMKWKVEGSFYKADYLGYEALSEVLISKCLAHSNFSNFVHYEPVTILYHDEECCGCESRNFLSESQELLTAERLYRQLYGSSLAKALAGKEVSEKIIFFVEKMLTMTGLLDFGKYLTALLEIDAFFLNEDRHTHNIAVLRDDRGIFSLCPLFDQGAGLLSDMTNDYKLSYSVEKCLMKMEAKPFSTDFDEQIDAAETMFGTQLRFSFTPKEVEQWVEEAGARYDETVRARVLQVMYLQMRKYRYLFE